MSTKSESFTFVTKDPAYSSRFLPSLADLRNIKELCDVVLRVSDGTIYAHKAVLSACSPFFKTMFTSSFSESNQREIELLHDSNHEVMSAIVDYMYSGSVAISLNQISKLLNNFDYLQMNEAKEQWETMAISLIQPNNCIEVFLQLESIQRSSPNALYDSALSCLLDNLNVIRLSSGFKDLDLDQLESILSKVAKTEADTISAIIMNWIKHDLKNRQCLLENLLSLISVRNLSALEIHNIVNNEFLKNDNNGCKWLVKSFLGNGLPVLHKALHEVLHIFDFGQILQFDIQRKPLMPVTRKTHTKKSLLSVTRFQNDFYVRGYKSEFGRFNNSTYEYTNLSHNIGDFGKVLCAGHDCIYLIGSCSPFQLAAYASLYRCDQNQILDLPNMLNARWLPGVAFYNSAVYVIGGTPNTKQVERFDPREGHWSIAGEIPIREWCSAAVLSNSIYCVNYNNIINYDPRSQRNYSVENWNGTSIATLDGILYVAHLNGIAKYNHNTNCWNQISLCEFYNPLIIS